MDKDALVVRGLLAMLSQATFTADLEGARKLVAIADAGDTLANKLANPAIEEEVTENE